MGFLNSTVSVQQCDPSKEDYGVAYANRDNVGTAYHASQKEIQLRCKEFAQRGGFQLKVQHYSSKREGSGNAQYVCKKLNGMQFFDKTAPSEEIKCPFSINVRGFDGFWKISRANFCHNHIKHVGFSSRPVAESSVARPEKDKRNTTQSVREMTKLVELEMLPLYEGKTERMTGSAISEFLPFLSFC
eukprot:jgi/Phyca11/118082/e_gw1.35.167.1